MNKDDVLAAFEDDLANPGNVRTSGQFLTDHVRDTAAHHLRRGDRAGVIDALREWMHLCQEPQTMVAVRVAAALYLTELRPEVESIRGKIAAGALFAPYYLRWLDEAIVLLNDGGGPSPG